MWESVKNFIDGLTNNPTFVTLLGVLGTLVSGLILFSKTTLGKKALEKLTSIIDETKEKAKQVKEITEKVSQEVNDFKEKLVSELSNFKEECKNQVSAVYGRFTLLENDLYDLLAEIPNAKVQEKLRQIKDSREEKEQEIENMLGDTVNKINKRINEEVEKKTKEADSKLAYLTQIVEKLQEEKEHNEEE